MIRRIYNITEPLEWMDSLIHDELLSTPFCGRERVLSLAQKGGNLLLEAYKGGRRLGIFCLMVLDEEKYIETLFLYAREKGAYEILLKYLRETYPGYEAWFVLNPKNPVLRPFLSERHAFFYEEQRYMEYCGGEADNPDEVIPYCDLYQDEYIKIHSRDGYWDGGKVLEKKEDFCIFLSIKSGRIAGYMDLSQGSGIKEIMDLLVLPEYRNQGIGSLLLRKAIFFSRESRLVLTVDTSNAPANHLYEKMGFREIPMNGAVTAKLTL